MNSNENTYEITTDIYGDFDIPCTVVQLQEVVDYLQSVSEPTNWEYTACESGDELRVEAEYGGTDEEWENEDSYQLGIPWVEVTPKYYYLVAGEVVAVKA